MLVEANSPIIKVPTDYPTIQEAINAANPGDTIYISSGIYYEHVIIDKSVSLIGEDRDTTIIDGSGWIGYVIVVTDDNVEISGLTIFHGGHGIGVIPPSSGCVISQNVISNHTYMGIQLISSPHNTINGNVISNNNAGIVLTCVLSPIVYSDFNTITGNLISGNSVGVQLEGDYNIIVGNTISNNGYGILNFGRDNTIYHNNFIDNIEQALTEGINTWDDGYPSGGNYWSDHNPPDVYCGPYQNETGRDKIGDTPYIINENNKDRYPLIYPYNYIRTPDLNNDKIVDIYDVIVAANAYGSYPGHPRWNPIVDTIQDGIIDIYDAVILAGNFGKTD